MEVSRFFKSPQNYFIPFRQNNFLAKLHQKPFSVNLSMRPKFELDWRTFLKTSIWLKLTPICFLANFLFNNSTLVLLQTRFKVFLIPTKYQTKVSLGEQRKILWNCAWILGSQSARRLAYDDKVFMILHVRELAQHSSSARSSYPALPGSILAFRTPQKIKIRELLRWNVIPSNG